MKPARAAFSLLELMLALSLLAALMAVAWSLLGTYRDAEQRGWRLSHRTTTIRSARSWLEKDAEHFELSETSVGGIEFIGDALGFSATISPSVDPLPFLEQLMSGAPLEETAPNSTGMLDDRDDLGNSASLGRPNDSMWPAESQRVEYRLTAMSTNSGPNSGPNSTLNSILNDKPEDQQFELIRREWTLGDLAVQGTANGTANGLFPVANEKILSAEDLYRQSDDSALESGIPSRESKLDGIRKVRFQYYDGTAWKSDWNSVVSGGLPKALALGFDFPANSQLKKTTSPVVSNQLASNQLASNQLEPQARGGLGADLPFAESALGTEPTADQAGSANQQSLIESGINEIQIVVYIGRSAPRLSPLATRPQQPSFP